MVVITTPGLQPGPVYTSHNAKHVFGFLTCAGQRCLSPRLRRPTNNELPAKGPHRPFPLRVKGPHSAAFGGGAPESSIRKGL